MPRPDFAVALFNGEPRVFALARPEGYMLWSSFCWQARGRFSPAELLQAEWRLRGGGVWTTLERDLTILAAFPGSQAGEEMVQILGAITERQDATVH